MNNKHVNTSINKPEQLKSFISGIKILATKYNISQEEVLLAANEAVAKGFKYEYFYEPKIEIKLNNQNMTILAYQKVVETEDEFEHDGHITLDEAKKIKHDAQVGEYILLDEVPEVDFKKWSRKTINIFNQILIQKCKEISRQSVIKNYSKKVGTLVKGIVEGNNRNNTGFLVRLFDGNIAFLPKYFCSPSDNITISANNHVKFLIHSVASNDAKYSDYPVILSRDTEKFVIELFNEVIPEIKDNLITIKCGARVAGVKTKIVAQSHNQYIHVVGAFIGANEERINIIRKEIANERVEIVQYVDDKLELIKKIIHHIQPLFIAHDMLFNEKTGNSVPTKFLVVEDLDLGRAVGPRWINVELLKRLFNENWTAITHSKAKERNLKPLENFGFSHAKSNNNGKTHEKSREVNHDDKHKSISEVKVKEESTKVVEKSSNAPANAKNKKINFKDIEVNLNKKESSLSLEVQLDSKSDKIKSVGTKPSFNRNQTNNGSKFNKPNPKFVKPIMNSNPAKDKNEELKEIEKQNKILQEQWKAQNKLNIKDNIDNYNVDEDFDETIDLNDEYNDLYE